MPTLSSTPDKEPIILNRVVCDHSHLIDKIVSEVEARAVKANKTIRVAQLYAPAEYIKTSDKVVKLDDVLDILNKMRSEV